MQNLCVFAIIITVALNIALCMLIANIILTADDYNKTREHKQLYLLYKNKINKETATMHTYLIYVG